MKISSNLNINNNSFDINKINTKKDNSSFSEYFNSSLDKLKDLQSDADNYKKILATGDVDNIHEVMIATEKAEIALQFTVNIQNKVVEAYKEIMRMQI